ncbi:C-type lectin domain family 10 member A-like [Symphorus nematophorus]
MLSEHIQALAKERDLMIARQTEMTDELERLKSLSKQVKTCPIGWRMFSCSCYLLSSNLGTWDEGRTDCRNRGADLVVIDSHKEQMFLSAILSELTNKHAWIGLSDREKEGTWKWIDGTPKGPTYWAKDQPDNGGGDPRFPDEDCAYMYTSTSHYTLWNDVSCKLSLRWICENTA